MVKKNKLEEMSITDAVDHLSALAELDEKKGEMPKVEIIHGSFKAVYDYLQNIYKHDKEHLKEKEMQRGLQAMMQLAGEAAQKLNKCSALFAKIHGRPAFVSEEFEKLQEFYLDKIVKRFEEVLETEEAWKEEWLYQEQSALDIERVGLKDLETVKKDHGYELFLIRDNEGKPYFNRNLLRHIRLVTDFDEIVVDKGEDPLLKIKLIVDKDLHATAHDMRGLINLNPFCQHALKFKEIEMINQLTKSVMALMLAGYERNMMQHASGKSSLFYMLDHLKYLRDALCNMDYAKTLSQDPYALDPLRRAFLKLVHELAFHLYTRDPMKGEAIQYIYDLIKRGSSEGKRSKKNTTYLSFLNSLLESQGAIDHLLKKYPSGPLFKTLDIFQDEVVGFDPLLQDNYPCKLFHFKSVSGECLMLRHPAPVSQQQINTVHIIDEYLSFLRHISLKKGKHLMVNLQNRTSWEEFARSEAVEKIQFDAEFAPCCVVVTLAKNTDFYHQADVYVDLHAAKSFIKQLQEQILAGPECGFFFPPSISVKDLGKFLGKLIPLIHKTFFGEKESLTRKNRLDFIEMVYFFLTFKLIEMVEPTYLSLMCKDSLDVGATMTAGFYLFLKIMSSEESFNTEEQDFVLWMTFAPALLVRERVVDAQSLSREVSAVTVLLESLGEDKKGIIKAFEALYAPKAFTKLSLDL